MGMDYQYAGSASYPRFDEEVKSLVEFFGGCETKELKHRKETENERPFGYWFGYMSSSGDLRQKYSFPEKTNPILVKWFNDIYGDFTVEETATVFAELLTNREKVNDISHQIFCELASLLEANESWHIC